MKQEKYWWAQENQKKPRKPQKTIVVDNGQTNCQEKTPSQQLARWRTPFRSVNVNNQEKSSPE